MTSFIHVDTPAQHPGVARAEHVAQSLQHAARSLDGARAGASLLLAAVVAALMVVANQVIDTWSEGHLLAAWMILWLVAFAALALFAAPARRTASSLRAAFKRNAQARRLAAEDDKLWRAAQNDPRIMADLNRAMGASAGGRPYY